MSCPVDHDYDADPTVLIELTFSNKKQAHFALQRECANGDYNDSNPWIGRWMEEETYFVLDYGCAFWVSSVTLVNSFDPNKRR